MTSPARILVVDDDAGVRKVVTMALEDEGYVVDTAENGSEAIEKSNTSFYNIALIDIRLPDMQGTNLLTAMKDTTPKMAKIIVTGYPGLESAVEAANRGADSYIVKPFKIDDLLRVVKEHLRKQEDAKKHGEEKIREFIETRAAEIERQR